MVKNSKIENMTKAFPTSDVQNDQLPYQERIRLRKIGQRRKRGNIQLKKVRIRIDTLKVGLRTGSKSGLVH